MEWQVSQVLLPAYLLLLLVEVQQLALVVTDPALPMLLTLLRSLLYLRVNSITWFLEHRFIIKFGLLTNVGTTINSPLKR